MKYQLSKNRLSEIINLRHHLHKYPELSGSEKKTAEKIIKFAKKFKIDGIISEIGGNSLIVRFDFKKGGDNLLIRADIDAILVDEINDFPYKSKNKHISHKCGHDGHAAIACGLISLISEYREELDKKLCGSLFILFQAAEETGEGALRVLNDPKFKKLTIDYCYALHNIPKYKKGTILYKDDVFASASGGMITKIYGKTSHAAEPENGKSPALAISGIIKELAYLPGELTEINNMILVTVVHAILGEKSFGVNPGYGEVCATIRALSNEDYQLVKQRAEQICKKNCDDYGLKLEIVYKEVFSAVENNPKCVQKIIEAATLRGLKKMKLDNSFKWSEDFGYFTSKFKGAMFGLGSGRKQANLHNPDYDFPDDIIEAGVDFFFGLLWIHNCCESSN